MSYGIVQIRSTVDARSEIEDTLELLNLGSVNNFTLVPKESSYKGMIKKVKDYTAYGEPSPKTVTVLLQNRAETEEGKKIDQNFAKDRGYSGLEEMSEYLVKGKTTLKEEGIKPKLRLHPPRKGQNSIKKTYEQGGTLGYHGNKIDELLHKMR